MVVIGRPAPLLLMPRRSLPLLQSHRRDRRHRDHRYRVPVSPQVPYRHPWQTEGEPSPTAAPLPPSHQLAPSSQQTYMLSPTTRGFPTCTCVEQVVPEPSCRPSQTSLTGLPVMPHVTPFQDAVDSRTTREPISETVWDSASSKRAPSHLPARHPSPPRGLPG